MSLIEQIAFAMQALWRSLAVAFRPLAWLPWLPLLALRVAVVAFCWWFAHPALSWFMAPLLARFAGPDALHYPGLFAAVPALFARADIVLEVLIGPLAIGAAALLFADRFQGRAWEPGRALGEAWRRYPALLLTQLPFHAAIVGLTVGFSTWLGAHKHGLLLRVPGRIAVIGGAALAETLLFFIAALVMLERRSLFDALAALPAAIGRAFWAILVISSVPLVARLVLQALVGRAPMIASRGVPELVGVFTLADAALSTLAWLVLAGCATMIYFGAIATREDR